MNFDNINGFLTSVFMFLLSIYTKYSNNKNNIWIASKNACLYGLIISAALLIRNKMRLL